MMMMVRNCLVQFNGDRLSFRRPTNKTNIMAMLISHDANCRRTYIVMTIVIVVPKVLAVSSLLVSPTNLWWKTNNQN